MVFAERFLGRFETTRYLSSFFNNIKFIEIKLVMEAKNCKTSIELRKQLAWLLKKNYICICIRCNIETKGEYLLDEF